MPFALLLPVAQLREEDLRSRLGKLQAAEFLYETSAFPDLEYTFKHGLTYEVAYGGLLQDRRRSLHAQILKVIEESYPERRGEQVDMLARHALRGGIWDKAVNYSRQSGAKASSRSASRESVVHLEQALTALQHLPESRERQEQAVDIRLEMAAPLFALGDLGRREHYLREAETLVAGLRDQRRGGLVSSWLTHQFWIRGDPDRAVEFGQRAVAAGPALGDTRLQAAAKTRLGMVYYITGEFRPAIELLKSSLASLDRESKGRQPAVIPWFLTSHGSLSSVWLACAHSELGEFSEAARIAQEALRIAEATNDPWSLVHAYYAMGFHHVLQGSPGEAIPILERGVQIASNVEISITFALIAPVLGVASALAGRPHEGIALLEKSRDAASAIGAGNLQAQRVCWLSEACLLANQVDDAMKFAEQALQLARDHKERPNEARAHRLLGEIALYRNSPHGQAAEGQYHRGMELARKLEMRPLVAHCHLGLGKLYRRTDKREQAQEHLATATTMYREMGMTYWLEKAETAMTD